MSGAPLPYSAATALVSQLLDAWNDHDPDRVAEYLAPDYEGVDVAAREPQQGPAGAWEHCRQYLIAFPDLRFTNEQVIVDGSRVAVHWMAEGTQEGAIMHIPPTGKRVSVRGASLIEIEGDKVRRAVHLWDVAGLLRELGLLPDL